MRNSNSSLRNPTVDNQSQGELPKEWDYLSKRLAEVQKGLTIVQKKQSKLQKKFNKYTEETTQFHTELTQQILHIKSSLPTKMDITQEVLKIIENYQQQIKSSCNELIATRFDSYSLNFHERNDAIEIKIKSTYEQTKAYVDRAVFQLKEILKKYVKEQNQLQKKIDKSSRDNSPSLLPKNSLSKSKSAKRLFETTQKSQTSENNLESKNSFAISRSRESLSKESISSSGGNRVSYLRQKLKQFQKINKKYEAQPEKATKKQDKDQIMKKMRNYRQYLQQSESQLEPSNIMNIEDIAEYPNMKKNSYPLF